MTVRFNSAPPTLRNQHNSDEQYRSGKSRGRSRDRRDRSYSVQSPSEGVSTLNANTSLRNGGSRSHSRSLDDNHSTPVRSRSVLLSPDGDVGTTSFNATFRANSTTSTSQEQATPQLEISLKKTGSSSDTTIKSYHMVEWNGKRYRLTQTHFDGTQNRYLGFTEEHWKVIAEAQKDIWEKARESNPHFDFSNLTHNVDTGVVKYREAPGQPVQTIDLTNPSSTASPAPYADILPTIRKAQEVQKRVKPYPMKFTRGNPPRPTLASRKKPEKPPAPPANPLDSTPPPENIDWWRIDKKIANWFKKPSPPDSN
jgi:hypothetical protein